MQNRLFVYIEQGGTIMYILLALNVLCLSILLWKFIQIQIEHIRAKKVVDSIIKSAKDEYKCDNLKYIENDIYNKASNILLSKERGMPTLQIVATISPILGLLGTVIGVLKAFEIISKQGLGGSVDMFASSISLALITTIGGLIVALPAYIGYNYLGHSLSRLEAKYEKLIIGRVLNETIS